MVRRKNKTITESEIDVFFNWGLNARSRTLYLSSVTFDSEGKETGVDAGMAEYFIKGLNLLDRTRGKINVLMNNIGGDFFHGMAIYDAIRACRSPVDIEVYGQAMSMGAIILQAGDRRFMHPNSALMIHSGTVQTEKELPSESARQWSNYDQRAGRTIYEILAQRSGRYPSYWKTRCAHDRIFTSWETVKEGLADAVLLPQKKFLKVKGHK